MAIARLLLHYPPEVFNTMDNREGVKIDVWMIGVVVYQLTNRSLPVSLIFYQSVVYIF